MAAKNKSDAELLESQLEDWEWRINNLYYITDKDKKKVLFKLNRAQKRFFKGMWYRNIILKARQLGFTTFMLIFMLDACLFRPDTACGLIAHNKDVAERLFREKVKYAYERLPAEIRARVSARSDRVGEYVFSNGSSITVSTGFRGGTLRYLHVSEFGKICKAHPEKAKEIVTGAFEAVGKTGVITIESTAEGNSGYFFDYSQQAEIDAIAGKKLSQLDYKFFFFPWWDDPEYSIPHEDVVIPHRLVDYFVNLEKQHGIKLTAGQRAWYVVKQNTLGDDMKREYPSTPKEAFEQSIEGAYYATQFRKIHEENRICRVPFDPAVSVHTIWDLGVNDGNAIWFVQRCGREWHVINYFEGSGEGVGYYANILNEFKEKFGYFYGVHIGPHDLAVREWGNDGKTRWQSALEKGVRFTLAPDIGLSDGIECVRNVLPLCWFDEELTQGHNPDRKEGVAFLQEYRKQWDNNLGVYKSSPRHDHTSHAADGFRYFAVSLDLISNFAAARPAVHQTRKPTKAFT